MIYVTVGTMFLGFSRLIHAMDGIARDTGERVVIQRGMDATRPLHAEHFDFKSHEEILAIQREARVVVCHAGIGCVSEALRLKRPLVVVPRLKRYREHMNDHQRDLARALESRNWARVVYDIGDLAGACAAPPPAYESYAPARESLVEALKTDIAAMVRTQY